MQRALTAYPPPMLEQALMLLTWRILYLGVLALLTSISCVLIIISSHIVTNRGKEAATITTIHNVISIIMNQSICIAVNVDSHDASTKK